MPLFRRPDGDLVKDLEPVRQMMPFVIRGRNEAIVYHGTEWEISKTRAWLRKYNRARGDKPRATLFHLVIYACARSFHERPGLNRFVAGGRIYQRKGVWISFAAKTELAEDAPLVTVKVQFSSDENFEDYVKKIVEAIKERRSGRENRVDREVRWLTKLPVPLLRVLFAGGRLLDRLNLLPASIIEPDPMYTSMFLGNLGSIHLNSAQHHLYEYGTCSLFGVVGAVRSVVNVDRNGNSVVRQVLPAHWSIDERVNDGFYCVETIAMVQSIVENPERHIGSDSAQTVTARVESGEISSIRPA